MCATCYGISYNCPDCGPRMDCDKCGGEFFEFNVHRYDGEQDYYWLCTECLDNVKKEEEELELV